MSKYKILMNLKQLLTLQGVAKKDGRKIVPEDLSILENACVVINTECIPNIYTFVGLTRDLPKHYLENSNSDSIIVDAKKYIMAPEFIDAHTHLAFFGDRAREYVQKLNGESYENIAKLGGGILESMRQTKAALHDSRLKEEFFLKCSQKVEKMSERGVKTIEIKSGYGGDFQSEYELSTFIDSLAKKFSPKIEIIRTFMAAHAYPQNQTSQTYLNEVVIPLMHQLNSEKKIDAVDIFVEEGYFSVKDMQKLFEQAIKLSLRVKMHVDEFKNLKAIEQALKYNPISVDHCLQTDKADIQRLAQTNTVVNLLPGTAFFLGKKLPNARDFLDAGCKVAMASDYNPGSCHFDQLLMIAQMSAKNLQMNIGELWASLTYNASQSLGLEQNRGFIKEGTIARYNLFETNSQENIFYAWGENFKKEID